MQKRNYFFQQDEEHQQRESTNSKNNASRTKVERILAKHSPTVITFILALFICILYSDIRQKKIVTASPSLQSGSHPNLAPEHNVLLMNELHLPFGKEEQILPNRQRKAHKDIKYAAFGSSHTWGARLANRDKEAYIKQIAKPYYRNGINHGIRSSGPNYPANCLYSLIGEEHFDVIILEYYMQVEDGLMLLATRLRQRFPDALIIFVHHWFPGEIVNNALKNEQSPIRDKRINVDEYRIQMGFPNDYIHDPKFHELLKETPDEWHKNEFYNPKEALTKDIASAVNGYIVKLPFNERRDGPGGWLHLGHQLLNDDSYHPSVRGHTFIANQVRNIVNRVGVVKNPRVQPFAQFDQCYNWLMDGKIDLSSVRYGSNFKLVKMPKTQKYALEFQNKVDIREGNNWVNITNHSNDIMDLYIGAMTTAPERKYPIVEASRLNGMKFELDPTPKELFGGKSVHVARMTYLGPMSPGVHTMIFFTPMESSEWPFRITSIMITPQNENQEETIHDGGLIYAN